MSEETPKQSNEEKPKRERGKNRRNVGRIEERVEGKKYLIRVSEGKDSTGKRHYYNETFHGTITEAKKRLRELLGKQSRGESLRLSNDTLDTFLNEWLKAHPDLKESTLDGYERALGYYVRPYVGNLLLKKVEAEHIQDLYCRLEEKKIAKSTIYFVHTLLRNIFKLAIQRRKIPFNPLDGVKSPGGKKLDQAKQQGREARTMSADQVAGFLEAADETRFGSIFTLAFYTGCRPGELLGLRWIDYDQENRIVKIRQSIHWRKGAEWYLDTPKTATGRRNLRLTPETMDLLDRHRRRQLEERMKVGRAWLDHDFIFCDEIGRPYSQSRLRYYCKQILKAAGLPKYFNPYSARHTSGTLLIQEGVNVKTVSERLGHANVTTTLKTYTHPTGEMHDVASDKAEALIKRKK